MTVGWIFEGDRDRLLAAREKTPNIASIVMFVCPFCRSNFPTPKQLDDHVHQAHTVKRPFILFSGQEPRADDVLRTSHSPLSIQTFNCDQMRASFDGEMFAGISSNELTKRLRNLQWASIRIELQNSGDRLTQPVVQRYRLTLIAPSDRSLGEVDRRFLDTLGTSDVCMNAVSRFYEMTRDPPISEYAEALGDYVRSVLLKDDDPRTGVSTRLHHHHEVQNKALNVLIMYQRPLAKALCCVLRFNLNDFSQWNEPSGFADLDGAFALLGPLSRPSGDIRVSMKKKTEGDYSQRIPIDFGTNSIAELAKLSVTMSRWGSDAENHFLALTEKAATDSLDRTKTRAIWASTALRLGANSSARRALQMLDDDPTFGSWANQILDEAF